jgi:uncharacterized membrane protein (DUF485 family)
LESTEVFFAVFPKNFISAVVILVWFFAFIVQLSFPRKSVNTKLEYYRY